MNASCEVEKKTVLDMFDDYLHFHRLHLSRWACWDPSVSILFSKDSCTMFRPLRIKGRLGDGCTSWFFFGAVPNVIPPVLLPLPTLLKQLCRHHLKMLAADAFYCTHVHIATTPRLFFLFPIVKLYLLFTISTSPTSMPWLCCCISFPKGYQFQNVPRVLVWKYLVIPNIFA